jgi:translocation and assembly module TamB
MADLRAIFRSVAKRLLLPAGIVIGIATLPAAGVLTFLLSPRGNEWLRLHLENYLAEKLHTRVSIGQIHFRTIYHLTILDFSLPDLAGNTLLSFKILSIKIQWGYWWKSYRSFFNDLHIERLNSTIGRRSDTQDFNFQFLLNAFASDNDKHGDTQPDIAWLIPELVDLSNASLKYHDDQNDDSASVSFTRLNAALQLEDEVVPANWIIQRMLLDSAVVNIVLGVKKLRNSSQSNAPAWTGRVKVEDFKVLRSAFHFTDIKERLAIESNLGHFQLVKGDFALAHRRFRANRLSISDHFTALHSGKTEQQDDPTIETAALDVSVDTVLIDKNRFLVDFKSHKQAPAKEFDPLHNDFQDINIAATGLRYRPGEISGRVSQLSFIDARRFRLRALKTDFVMNAESLRLDNLSLITSRNTVAGNMMWRYPSWERALADPETTRFKISARANTLNLGELAYFLPVLLRYRNIYPLYRQDTRANVQASGSPRNIRLDHLDIATNHNHAQGKGEIHIPKRGDTWLVLDIKNGLSGKSGLLDVVSPDVLSPALLDRIPEKIRLNGKMRITARSLQGSVALNSALGVLRLKGILTNYSDLNHVSYNLAFETRNFNLAQIVKDTLLGPATAHGRVRGTGLADPTRMMQESAGYIDRMNLAGRNIESVLFDTRLSGARLSGNLASSNPDLNFELSPTIYFNRPDSLGNILGTIYNANLRKLGLVRDSLQVGGWIMADLSKFSGDSLIGNLKISSANVQFRGKSLNLDYLTIEATHPGNEQILRLKSALADIDLSGRFSLRQIPSFGTDLANSILQSKPFPVVAGIDSFQMQGKVHAPSEALVLAPELSQLAPFSFTSHYESDTGIFDFKTQVDSLTIGGIAIDSAFIQLLARRNVVTSTTETDYILGAKDMSGPSIALPNTQVSVRTREGVHTGELISSETTPGSLLRIPFAYNAQRENPFVTLQDSVYFRGELWKVNPGNAIYPFARNLAGSQLKLASGSKSAAFMASGTDKAGLPYQMRLANINLGPIFELLKADSTFLAGSASGTVSVSQLHPLALTALINVDNLQVKGAALGKMNAEVKSESADRYSLRMNIHPILNALGTYEPSKSAGVLSVDINSFPVTPLKGLFENEIDSLQGAVSGHLAIKTSPSGTSINGLVRIDSSTFAIRETGSRVHVAGGGLAFAGDKINLEPILLRDNAGGQATLTGSMDITGDHDLKYKLKLDAKRFRTIGDLRGREQLVYGNGKTDANLELSGNLGQFRLTGQVALNDSSQIFYRSAAVSGPDFGEGLLEFATTNQEIQSANTSARTINRLINTNISVPSNATLTLLLDEYRGEKVIVRGKSNLNYSQHAGGEMQLNGKYEVTSGTYTFSVGNNIRKEFALENGGTIQWMGDLYQPICDLTAVYKVNTSAGALMQGTDTDAEAGRRKFDFLVKLKLKGSLSKPEISFELGMNETDQDAFDGAVYSKIKQINGSQSDVTKQVMSLLVLNSFMGDSPFGSLSQFSSNALEAGAYNTIGNLLTRQLNNMLAGMVKAVDITLGVNWSESVDGGRSSTRSDIKLGIGKSLFNHRLNLYVGNNFGVETLSGNNSGISGLANDVSVEYLLNPEGKYRIKGYHVRDNEMTLHGEHMETGVKFTIIWEFNQQEARRVHKKNIR